MRSEKTSFLNRQGLRLAGRLERPDAGEPLACVVFSHCFTCHKDFKAGYYLSRALTRLGLAVLRFDFPGLGESEGDFANTTLSGNAQDVAAAAAFAVERTGAPPLLLGHSMGGAAAVLAAGRLPAVRAVATLGTPFEPGRLPSELAGARERARSAGQAEVRLGGPSLRLGRAFFDDLEGLRLEVVVASLGKPLLVFHSPRDEVVPFGEAERLFAAAAPPKVFATLDDADHLLSREADAAYLAEVLGAWVRRHLGRPEEAGDPVPDGAVVVRAGPSGLAADVRAGRHLLRADEPEPDGGTDTGPNPYQYLLGALGACTCMTLRLYADRKGWPLEGTEVRLAHDRLYAEDCADCETKTGRVDRITRAVALTGPLDEAQRQRLREIADRCPVHRTLTSEIRIETSLRKGGDAPGG